MQANTKTPSLTTCDTDLFIIIYSFGSLILGYAIQEDKNITSLGFTGGGHLTEKKCIDLSKKASNDTYRINQEVVTNS